MSTRKPAPAHTLITRMFEAIGQPCPKRETHAYRQLETCPRERLARAVAWYAMARGPDAGSMTYSHQRLLDGLRFIAQGWGDVRIVSKVARGAATVHNRGLVGPGAIRRCVEIRTGKSTGRWHTVTSIRHTDGVRSSRELATAWLEEVAHAWLSGACVVHDDCVHHPALGRACAVRTLEHVCGMRQA